MFVGGVIWEILEDIESVVKQKVRVLEGLLREGVQKTSETVE